MSDLPIECRARFEAIGTRAQELHETFLNGNKGDVVQALEEMEPRAAFAVLAEMMLDYGHSTRRDLHRYLKEVA